MDEARTASADLHLWKAAIIADFGRIAARDHWGRALMIVGWVHLAFFTLNQVLYTAGGYPDPLFAVLWLIELLTLLIMLRALLGRGWFRCTPMAATVVRVWATFFILAFNVSMLNSMKGWTVDWFKLVWTTLSSFGFATMAWLLHLSFLVFAFQMYFTGLLMVRYPAWNYLIFGVSWCAALQVIGLALERRGARASNGDRRSNPSLGTKLKNAVSEARVGLSDPPTTPIPAPAE